MTVDSPLASYNEQNCTGSGVPSAPVACLARCTMSIAGNCPGCGHAFRFPESARGQSARCKTCGEQFCVPPRVVVLEQSPARPRLSAFGYVRWVGVPLIALAFFGWIAAHLAVRAFTKHQQADQPADQQLGS